MRSFGRYDAGNGSQRCFLGRNERGARSIKIKNPFGSGGTTDLSENSEYEDAKNQQAFVEGRIAELEERIRNAVIIANPKGKKVSLGSVVTIKDQNGETLEYTIVGSAEADPFEDKISNESPVGKALIGKKAKDKVTVQAPEQVLEYEIVKVVNTAGKKKA